MNKLIFIAIVSLFSSASFAWENPADWKVKVELVNEGVEAPDIFPVETYMNRDACVGREIDPTVALDTIISLGQKLWTIVQNGAPVLNFEANSVSAIPNGAICPFNMSGWSIPQSRTYKITYTNLMGIDVVSFQYKVIYSYGGQYGGRGAYLTNVSVHPADIHVLWGQNFDADVNIASILNVGTAEDPVAGVQVNVEWNFTNPLNKFKSQRVYFVEGRGSITEL